MRRRRTRLGRGRGMMDGESASLTVKQVHHHHTKSAGSKSISTIPENNRSGRGRTRRGRGWDGGGEKVGWTWLPLLQCPQPPGKTGSTCGLRHPAGVEDRDQRPLRYGAASVMGNRHRMPSGRVAPYRMASAHAYELISGGAETPFRLGGVCSTSGGRRGNF